MGKQGTFLNNEIVQSGGRRAAVSETRAEIACKLVEGYGISLSEVTRNVGLATSGIFRIFKRYKNKLV